MQKQKFHMALIKAKDGNVLGLVTLEDLLEEIFGEIHDEHDITK
jgi:putative hemolysin